MIENLNKNSIAIAIVIAGILVAGAFLYTNQTRGGLSAQEAAARAIAFINQTIQEDVTASLVEVAEVSGVYRIHLQIAEEEYDSYITKDGDLLFASGFNLAEQLGEVSQEEEAEQDAAALASLAQCLTDSGAKFYGAYWCSWCNKQKELFAEAVDLLPYVECIDKATDQATPECQAAGISSFPTWEFNGEQSSGFKTLEQLAELSGCPLQ